MTRRYELAPSAGVSAAIDYPASLNAQQLAAVTSPPGAALVIAGAGSGKTRTLTYRVAWLLEQGVPPWEILLLTFTNKAAREMLDRVAGLLPSGAAGIWGGTFHSVGNRILRRHADRAGFRAGFTIMDRDDQEDLIESVVAREGLRTSDRRFPKGEVLGDIFSFAINTGTTIAGALSARYRYFLPLSAQIERAQIAYEGRKREANVMDFDDLLAKMLELFHTAPEVGAKYQDQFRHILVDEYQDTNRLQAGIVDFLSRRHGNLMVVGDDAQSIYSWRGANFENILRFPDRHPGARVFKIETNYRSVPAVLDVANAAIRANERQFRKVLDPAREALPFKPALVALATNTHQAAFVAQRVIELNEEGVDFAEMAVLYRAHYHSMEVQMEFTRRGIPFSITSGLRFFEQAHVKDVAAFLKFAVNPRDETAFKRMVRLLPGVGAKSAGLLWEAASALLAQSGDVRRLAEIKAPRRAENSWRQLVHTLADLMSVENPLAPATMIEAVLFAIYDDTMKARFANYEARREDLATLANFAGQFETSADFLSELALLSSAETAPAAATESEKVSLSTIHQAKGLEWKIVFLIWLTEGMFPSARSAETPEGVEEERRLFYVGVTRCQDELYLSYPFRRLNAAFGESFQRPSRFLSEIPEELLETWEVATPGDSEQRIPF